jgi:hypothetical protein
MLASRQKQPDKEKKAESIASELAQKAKSSREHLAK